MKFNRRQILVAGTTFLATPYLLRTAYANSPASTLPIPPIIEAKNGEEITLTMQKGRHAFISGHSALSAGINGTYLGPTLRLKNKQNFTLNVKNHIGEDTTLHWHGLFVPSNLDGGPHNIIENGKDWKINVKVNQPTSTNWYHPHLHQNTARQAHMGLAGLIYVDDGLDEKRGLPNNYGVDDIPIVLQDRRIIDGDNIYQPDLMDFMHGYRGNHIIANGLINAFMQVPNSIIRLRFLNGANARIFNLQFSDNRPFHVFASDGGMINKAVRLNTLKISPGERYEVLVDCTDNQNFELLTSANDDGSGDQLPVLLFSGNKELEGTIKQMPTEFDGAEDVDVPKNLIERDFVFNDRMQENMMAVMKNGNMQNMRNARQQNNTMMMGDHSMMHGGRDEATAGPALTAANSGMVMSLAEEPFDMNRIDVEAKLGSYELWNLYTLEMGHPFHIHGASFRIISKNGEAVLPHESGWKDTAYIEGQATVLIHFDRKATKNNPFMFHCHMLEHEDLGMMGQFITT